MKGQRFSAPRLRLITIALLAWVCLLADSASAHTCSPPVVANAPAPETTVILSNATDARFSRDFSPLLKQLRLPWVTLDSTIVPVAVRDKNLILLGRLDAAYSGAIMRQLLTDGEEETIHAATTEPIVITKESPWMSGRVVTICTGSDLLLTRNAAEQAIRRIIASRHPISAWIEPTFDAPLDDDLHLFIEQLRFTWADEELPLPELLFDVGARPRALLSAPEAAADVERLFHLLAHGYAGYAFFNQQGQFAQAKARILEELATRDSWSTTAFAGIFAAQLSFITDCHLRIGDHQFAGHADFWHDTTLELTLDSEGYSFATDGHTYSLLSVDGEEPEPFLFPSLNAQGVPIYRLGVLAQEQPAPLLLLARDGAQERRFEISLQRSEYDYYAEDIFREDNLGGIPVIRVRSFADVWAEDLSRFVETGRRHRGRPVVVVDIRGNNGGNEAWPADWIQGLIGRRAESVFISSELASKTTMAGRANLFAQLAGDHPEISSFAADFRRYMNNAEALESGARQPSWTSPHYPQVPILANDTTLIIVFNGLAASAGEGLILRASQAENVVLVGENSRGCLTFGNTTMHQLPHSRLTVQLPINFGLFLDGQFREGKGLAPDLWVPAADAVNYAIAAVRRGTISTVQPLSATTLQQPFVPEDPWARLQRERIVLALIIMSLAAAGSIWAYFMRRRPRIVAAAGSVWLAIGAIWLSQERLIGLGFLLTGAICLLGATSVLFRTHRARQESAG